MKIVFTDTAHYVGLMNAKDAHHKAAVGFDTEYPGNYLTTEFILVETATFFLRPAERSKFLALVADLRADNRVTILPASAELFEKGLQLFAARPDKAWSLTDCTSFVAMTEQRVTDALTADQHFAQAGFVPLLA